MTRMKKELKDVVTKETASEASSVVGSVVSETISDTVSSGSNKVKDLKNKFLRGKRGKMALLGLVALLVLGYFYYNYYNSSAQVAKRQEKAVQQLVKTLSRFILLPQDEKPVVYKINNISELQQAFFKDAKNGDDLIVYQKAQKALIYSSERKVLVNVGPITFDAAPQTQKN